ncbi:hypothetical protein [uncultured Pseudoalteromonas sp.]|uniref:hypothetical protein n=1 Tax=uncultured Pseudoalteromonas sp. TaxID=114053 RepID=UPI002596E237|nr:hypothetical protein [uncultured Pseudoalteromonas sp.]
MSIFEIYDKSKHLKRANKLLISDSSIDHYYACLELRFCIEAIVYQKLLHGINKFPKPIVETWQPHKAMKMLEEIDNFATSSCVVHFNLAQTKEPPKEGWNKLGEQKIPKVKWLAKSYNKLGNFLHLAEPSKSVKQESRNVREKVGQIAKDLEPYMSGNLVLTINHIELGCCPVCDNDFIFSPVKVKNGEYRRCSNYQCGAIFVASRKENESQVTFRYKTFDIECQNCCQEVVIPENKVRSLEGFKCNTCESQYVIKANYEFALLPDKKN